MILKKTNIEKKRYYKKRILGENIKVWEEIILRG